MTMISKSGIVSIAGLAVLLGGCATDPLPPSLSPPQYLVLVKGEPGPLKTFEDLIGREIAANRIKDCKKTLPPIRDDAAKGAAGGQLAYECKPADKAAGNEQLQAFATAYGNSIASLLEMKITTADCIARSCYGGAYRYWYRSPPCSYVCN